MSEDPGNFEARLIEMINSMPVEITAESSSSASDPFPPHMGHPDWLTNTAAVLENAPLRSGATAQLRTIEELMLEPSAQFIVRGLVPSRGLIAVFGPPGSGKSFLVMDLAFSIAAGGAGWFGRPLVQTSVAYVALEGQGGLKKRICAWQEQAARAAPSNVRFRTADLSLLERRDAEDLGGAILTELGSGTVVVVDTLSRAAAGGDENSSTDMSLLIANAELVGSVVNGPVILVHHTGKNADKGMRGHSSLLGAIDTAIEVTYLNGQRSWKVAKAKDDEAGGEHQFELVSYAVEKDQWGDEVRSCAVRPFLGPIVRAVPAPRGKHQVAIMLALRQGEMAATTQLAWGEALKLAAASLSTVASPRRATAAKAILQGLLLRGNIQLNEGKISLA